MVLPMNVTSPPEAPSRGPAEHDVRDLSARDRAANSRAVQHLRERQIVDVQRLAGDFLAALLAGDWFAD